MKLEERRKISKSKLLTVFSITTLIFIAGILLGNYFASKKLSQIDQLGQNFRTDTMAMEIQYDLLAQNPCQKISNTPLAEQIYELATKLDYMENQLGENNAEVISLKNYYQLLEIRHWMFSKKTNEECKQFKILILYFYSNKKDCPTCEQQGFILTWLRQNYPDNVLVYAFDYNIKNTALDTMKTMYEIKGTPAIVINDETYNRFMTKAELEEIVNKMMAKEAEAQGAENITKEQINE